MRTSVVVSVVSAFLSLAIFFAVPSAAYGGVLASKEEGYAQGEELDDLDIQREREADALQWSGINDELRNWKADPITAKLPANGYTGEPWVSATIKSGSSGFAGHAAIVAVDERKTVESFARKFSPVRRDGVVLLQNTWASRRGVIRLGVNGSNPAKRRAAASWAQRQIGRPYNWNFRDKRREDKFYCSQLVWIAWLKQGIDIEKGSIPNGAVTPSDLVNSSNTRILFRRA